MAFIKVMVMVAHGHTQWCSIKHSAWYCALASLSWIKGGGRVRCCADVGRVRSCFSQRAARDALVRNRWCGLPCGVVGTQRWCQAVRLSSTPVNRWCQALLSSIAVKNPRKTVLARHCEHVGSCVRCGQGWSQGVSPGVSLRRFFQGDSWGDSCASETAGTKPNPAQGFFIPSRRNLWGTKPLFEECARSSALPGLCLPLPQGTHNAATPKSADLERGGGRTNGGNGRHNQVHIFWD
eukprot:gene5907-biopygen7254